MENEHSAPSAAIPTSDADFTPKDLDMRPSLSVTKLR